MAKLDKEQQAQIAGMLYMFDYAKKNGIEAAELEVRRRGYTNMPIRCTEAQLKTAFREMCENVYQMMLTAILYAAHEEFGFGGERLYRLRNKFNQLVEDTYDLDYMSCHYITMGDYARELQDKYEVLTDLTRIDKLQMTYDKKDANYRMCNIDRVLEELKDKGYDEAAGFLEKKLA